MHLQAMEWQRLQTKHQKLGHRREQLLSSSPAKESSLPTYWFQTYSLQNDERINLCSPKAPSLCYFVTASLGNQYATYKWICFAKASPGSAAWSLLPWPHCWPLCSLSFSEDTFEKDSTKLYILRDLEKKCKLPLMKYL